MLGVLTIFHVVISLLGICAGFFVLYGLFTSKRMEGWTSLFLATTAVTSLTGFLFPIHQLTPGIALGILSIILLAFSTLARYPLALAGAWRPKYVVTAMAALYLKCFRADRPALRKGSGATCLAPTHSEPPFQVTQIAVLIIFVVLTILAAIKFHVEPRQTSLWMARTASTQR